MPAGGAVQWNLTRLQHSARSWSDFLLNTLYGFLTSRKASVISSRLQTYSTRSSHFNLAPWHCLAPTIEASDSCKLFLSLAIPQHSKPHVLAASKINVVFSMLCNFCQGIFRGRKRLQWSIAGYSNAVKDGNVATIYKHHPDMESLILSAESGYHLCFIICDGPRVDTNLYDPHYTVHNLREPWGRKI
jgi:hypothetical protein